MQDSDFVVTKEEAGKAEKADNGLVCSKDASEVGSESVCIYQKRMKKMQ